MTLADLEARIAERRAQLGALRAQVDAAATYDEMLEWIRAVQLPDEPLLTLTRAAELTGYAADSLGRMVREGRLKNHGRRRRPLIRLSECPAKGIPSPSQSARVITPSTR